MKVWQMKYFPEIWKFAVNLVREREYPDFIVCGMSPMERGMVLHQMNISSMKHEQNKRVWCIRRSAVRWAALET